MAFQGRHSQNGPSQIGFATSSDGVNWNPYPQNPVVTYGSGDWDAGGVNYPMIVKVGDMYYVYYHAYSVSWSKQGIGLAKVPISQIPIPENFSVQVMLPLALGSVLAVLARRKERSNRVQLEPVPDSPKLVRHRCREGYVKDQTFPEPCLQAGVPRPP